MALVPLTRNICATDWDQAFRVELLDVLPRGWISGLGMDGPQITRSELKVFVFIDGSEADSRRWDISAVRLEVGDSLEVGSPVIDVRNQRTTARTRVFAYPLSMHRVPSSRLFNLRQTTTETGSTRCSQRSTISRFRWYRKKSAGRAPLERP